MEESNNNNNNNPTNNNEIKKTNQNHYNNLEIEKNSFNLNNKSNEGQNYYEKALASESEAIKALIKLDMVHPTNNYYNNIVEPKNAYKVFIRPDGKPDFGNYAHFNNYVKFDPKKYQRPEIFYGFVHDQYLVPQILNSKVNNDKKKESEKNDNKEDLKNNSKINNKTIKAKNNSQKSNVNNVKSLDDIMNKFNLKYIEPPPKENKVTPPPEEVPPEEEEDNKDKNKGKKESAKSKTNIKDDKNKANKPTKK